MPVEVNQKIEDVSGLQLIHAVTETLPNVRVTEKGIEPKLKVDPYKPNPTEEMTEGAEVVKNVAELVAAEGNASNDQIIAPDVSVASILLESTNEDQEIPDAVRKIFGPNNKIWKIFESLQFNHTNPSVKGYQPALIGAIALATSRRFANEINRQANEVAGEVGKAIDGDLARLVDELQQIADKLTDLRKEVEQRAGVTQEKRQNRDATSRALQLQEQEIQKEASAIALIPPVSPENNDATTPDLNLTTEEKSWGGMVKKTVLAIPPDGMPLVMENLGKNVEQRAPEVAGKNIATNMEQAATLWVRQNQEMAQLDDGALLLKVLDLAGTLYPDQAAKLAAGKSSLSGKNRPSRQAIESYAAQLLTVKTLKYGPGRNPTFPDFANAFGDNTVQTYSEVLKQQSPEYQAAVAANAHASEELTNASRSENEKREEQYQTEQQQNYKQGAQRELAKDREAAVLKKKSELLADVLKQANAGEGLSPEAVAVALKNGTLQELIIRSDALADVIHATIDGLPHAIPAEKRSTVAQKFNTAISPEYPDFLPQLLLSAIPEGPDRETKAQILATLMRDFPARDFSQGFGDVYGPHRSDMKVSTSVTPQVRELTRAVLTGEKVVKIVQLPGITDATQLDRSLAKVLSRGSTGIDPEHSRFMLLDLFTSGGTQIADSQSVFSTNKSNNYRQLTSRIPRGQPLSVVVF